MEVRGRAQTLYRTNDAAVGTRTDTPLELVPQSIQVVADRRPGRARSPIFTAASAASASAMPASRCAPGERALRRSARRSVCRLLGAAAVQHRTRGSAARPVRCTAVVMRAASSTARKPKARAEHRIELQAGDLPRRVDRTGPLNASGSIRYRAGLYADSEQGVRWNSDSAIGDTSLAFDVGQTGELVRFTDITRTGGNRLRGVPVNDAGTFLTDRRWNHNEASDFSTCAPGVAQYRFATARYAGRGHCCALVQQQRAPDVPRADGAD